MLGSEWAVGQVFWSMIWFTLFFIWIWLLIMVFADIFRSHDMGGFAKFIWVLFVIVLPYLGVFVYLIARGHKMGEHAMAQAIRPSQEPRLCAKTCIIRPPLTRNNGRHSDYRNGGKTVIGL